MREGLWAERVSGMQKLGYVLYCCCGCGCGILERKREVGNGRDSADESGTHPLYA